MHSLVFELQNLIITYKPQAKLTAKEYWLKIKQNETVPLHKLLSEMLDYVNT